MGIVKDGVMGLFINKVGTVIGRQHRGQNVIVAKYRKSQKQPTQKQLDAQMRFGMLNHFLSKMEELVDPGFEKTVKAGQSPINAAYAFNYKHAFTTENGQFKLNMPKLVLSRGPVQRPNCATVTRAGNKIVFSWLAQPENQYCRYNDKASFELCTSDTKIIVHHPDKAFRSDLQFEVTLPKGTDTNTFHCFMVFSNTTGKIVGDSEYVGYC